MYADGIWSRPPTPEATAPLSGRDDEFVTLDELSSIAVDAGFDIVSADEATLDEWDAFESGFTARYDTWLATHSPDHPDAASVRERAAQSAGVVRRRLPRGARDGVLAAHRE